MSNLSIFIILFNFGPILLRHRQLSQSFWEGSHQLKHALWRQTSEPLWLEHSQNSLRGRVSFQTYRFGLFREEFAFRCIAFRGCLARFLPVFKCGLSLIFLDFPGIAVMAFGHVHALLGAIAFFTTMVLVP